MLRGFRSHLMNKVSHEFKSLIIFIIDSDKMSIPLTSKGFVEELQGLGNHFNFEVKAVGLIYSESLNAWIEFRPDPYVSITEYTKSRLSIRKHKYVGCVEENAYSVNPNCEKATEFLESLRKIISHHTNISEETLKKNESNSGLHLLMIDDRVDFRKIK